MSLAFVVWFLVSLFLLGFWGWSIYVVLKQKHAWKFYAEKRKLRYHPKGFLETPSVSGVVDNYGLSLFASEHGELDGRSQKHLTAIEITLHTTLPVACAAASGGMAKIVEGIGIHQEYKPPAKGWDDSYIIRAQDLGIVREYMNSDRLDKLIQLMKVEKAWVIFLFLNGKGLLRLDTPLPIDNPKEIDALIKKMISVAKTLELKDGEDKALIRQASQSDDVRPVLDIDEDLLADHLGLELEDDE